ncbi:MAG: FtsX-like permease family protein [Thermoguttaceae bacterium]
MVLWKFTIREIKSRPGRATLTLLSIVISVAAVVAVTVSKNTTHQAYKDYESVAGRAAFEVVADQERFFDTRIIKTLKQVAGVKTVIPLVQKYPTRLTFNKQRPSIMVMGVDPRRNELYQDYELKQGDGFPKEESEEDVAMMEVGFAEALGVHVGDEIYLTHDVFRDRIVDSFKVIGLLAPRGTSNFNQGGIVFLPLGTAQYYYSKTGGINRASIILEGGVVENKVQADLAAVLPPGLQIRTPSSRMQMSQDTLKNAEQGLAFAFWLNIVLAIFMIFNTFLMNVGERRRQLSILRAIGTTRKQIMRMLILEGFAMGVTGTVLGCVLGVIGANLLTAGMMKVYSNSIPPLSITPGPFILAAVLGPMISLFGVIVPAYLAGKITPLEGMRPIVTEHDRQIPFSFVILAIAVFTVTGSLLAGSIMGFLPLALLPIFGVFFTAAFVMLVPIVLKGMSKGTAAVLYPLLKVEGQLASRQILRRRARATLTIGILYIAVSMAVSLGITLVNNVNEVRTWFDKTMNGDFFVRATSSEMARSSPVQIPESMCDDIRWIDGVKNVDSLSFTTVSVGDQSIQLCIREFTDKDNLPLVLKEGAIDEVRRGLSQGEVVIGTVLANRMNKKVGDEIELTGPKGPKKVRITGIATVYLNGGWVAYMGGQRAKEMMGVEGVDTFIVLAEPNKFKSVEAEMKKLCNEQGLILHSFTDLRKKLNAKLDGVIGSLWGLMGLGFIMGALGMANTLTMNVLEQTRELALLRVVAMTRRQVRKTILAQAAIIGVIGLLTGSLGGIIGSYTINLSSIPLFGHAADFAMHPVLVLACFAVGMTIILVAAWIPAERAARLNLMIALQYE